MAYATPFNIFLVSVHIMCWDLQQENLFGLLSFLECIIIMGLANLRWLIFGLNVTGFVDACLKYCKKAIRLHVLFAVIVEKT